MAEPDHDLVKRLPLFSGLPTETMDALLDGSKIRVEDRPATLFREGEAPECLFVLLEGVVECFTGAAGKNAAILLLWPHELFLAAAALTDEPYLMSARTLGPARLVAIDAERARSAAQADAQLAMRFSMVLAGQFRMAIRQIRGLKMRSGPSRLGAFLLRLVAEQGKNGFADLPITKGLLASRLGLSPETLSRALHVLDENGVSVRGRRVVLRDRRKLEAFCGAEPLLDSGEAALFVTAL